MYQINERKLNRLLSSLTRIGERIDSHPMKSQIMGDPEAKEFAMALVDVQNEIQSQKITIPS